MKKISNAFWLLLVGAMILYAIFKISRNFAANNISDEDIVQVKAVIINKRNYMGNEPVDSKFSYSYRFEVNGRSFVGNAHDSSLAIGDSVIIVYDKKHPAINKPFHPKD